MRRMQGLGTLGYHGIEHDERNSCKLGEACQPVKAEPPAQIAEDVEPAKVWIVRDGAEGTFDGVYLDEAQAKAEIAAMPKDSRIFHYIGSYPIVGVAPAPPSTITREEFERLDAAYWEHHDSARANFGRFQSRLCHEAGLRAVLSALNIQVADGGGQ